MTSPHVAVRFFPLWGACWRKSQRSGPRLTDVPPSRKGRQVSTAAFRSRVLPARPPVDEDICRLDQTLVLLGERLQRVLTALALTLDARRELAERREPVPGHEPPDLGLLEMSAAQCRDIVKSLGSA